MKKKIIAFSMVIAMLAVIVVSGTLAYFTDTDEGVNVFTIGGIDIDLYEEVGVIDADGTTEYPERVVRFGDASAVYTNIMPSNTLKKKVTVENTGKNAAYVRVAVVLNDLKLIKAIDNFYEDKTVLGTYYPDASPKIEAVYDEMFPNWGVTYMKASDPLATADTSAKKMGNTMRRAIYIEDAKVDVSEGSSLIAIDSVRSTENETLTNENNWIHPTNLTRKFMKDYEIMYVYYLYLEPGDYANLFDGIKIPATFGNEQMEILNNFTVEIYADAIQAEGFTGADAKEEAKAAFEALELAHPFNSIERISSPVVDTEEDQPAVDTTAKTLAITNVNELVTFANNVNSGNTYEGYTVTLEADLDLKGIDWEPIGQTGPNQFKGVFDGNNHTISNLNIDSVAETGGNYSSALFGWLIGHGNNAIVIKNVKVDGAYVIGHHNVGVIAGYTTGNVTIENCHVANAELICTSANNDANGDKCGVIVGNATVESKSVNNCSATDCTVSAGRDAGQITGASKANLVTNCTATNVVVTLNGTSTGANIRNELIGSVLG